MHFWHENIRILSESKVNVKCHQNLTTSTVQRNNNNNNNHDNVYGAVIMT